MGQIVDTLHRKGIITVKELSEQLFMSEMTIRRYLDELEGKGLLKRTHGGALPVSPAFAHIDDNKYLISNEIDKNVQYKNKIGYYAASLINEGETVGFDIGTTVSFIPKFVPSTIKMSVICVTFKCAVDFYHKKNVNLLLTGGYLERDSDVFHSDEAISFLSKVRTDKVFISVAGIDKSLGLTCYHDFHVSIKKLLMASSKQVIVVADSSKFGVINPSFFGELSDVHTIITDCEMKPEHREMIMDLGIELIIAEEEKAAK